MSLGPRRQLYRADGLDGVRHGVVRGEPVAPLDPAPLACMHEGQGLSSGLHECDRLHETAARAAPIARRDVEVQRPQAFVGVVPETSIGQSWDVRSAMGAREGGVLICARHRSAFRVEGLRLRMRRVPLIFPDAGVRAGPWLDQSVTRFTAMRAITSGSCFTPDRGSGPRPGLRAVLATVTLWWHVPPVGVVLVSPAAAASPLSGARGGCRSRHLLSSPTTVSGSSTVAVQKLSHPLARFEYVFEYVIEGW